ncbi:putative RNA-directed DNA polymerase from transposon X-element [Araneus ventricosus]|uniref:Putative RNA-directed DNA polymerase from transposon X-element n=1 Tax=Araneus ventricosus TaxID=182803 RepID=A0A4Y2QHM7_ARAVE|nr:putative RNA-directed DNA polymerase from transposon X-element [Araneus ventricosus]
MVCDNPIETAVNQITATLIAAAENSIPKTKNNFRRQRKVWWNSDCREAYKNQRKAWGRFRRYPTSANLILYKQAKAYSRRIQRRSQRESWERYVSSLNSTISSKKLWEKVKKASGIFTDHNINILYQNGIPVTSLQDIANCIASTLSQTSNSNTYPSSFQNHKKLAEKQKLNFKSNSYAPYNTDFTFHELKVCLSEVKNTSPGPDNISYLMIKHLSNSSLQNLLLLYNRIWHEHCFPSSWQQAIIIPIPKPGKDPSNPLNYRPIALTNCLCKLMEKMVNRRLVYYLEHNKILSPFQSGFRPGRCTIDNLLALETDIRTTFLKRQHLVAIFFDIEKAYDRTWRYGILQDLFNCNLRGNLPIFIQNFLRLRQFRVEVGYQLSALFTQEEGVPQGSVLSVTLFALKINSIFKHLQPSIKSFLYVDDLYISCSGDNMAFIERQLQIAVNKLTQWSILNGFIFSTSKTSFVHFCRKRRLHPEPEIKLYGQVINVVGEVKFLGIIFDKKLTFLPHVLQLRKKLDRALNILKVLSNTSWGASRLSLLRVYRAAILSKIDYGCTIYGSARQSVLQKLNTIPHSALRLCSGAFRTSPVESLYVECHEPSLEHRRQMLTLHYFSKILTNPNHPYFNYKQSRFLQRLQDARTSVVPSFFTRAAGFLHDLNLDTAQLLPNPVILLTPWIPHGLKFLNPFENYDKTNTASDIYLQLFAHHRELYHHFIPVFTDGSKTTTQTSFACVFINSTLSFQLHPSCSIFTAEIRAILHSLSEISNYPADNYIIYSDSLSVLQALSSLHRHSHPLAFSILDLHDRLVCKGFSILLCWVPSHVGISGNEIADIAAKNASAVLDNTTPLQDFKRYINLALHSRWENHWNSQSMNKLRSIKPVVETWPTLTNRKADTIVTRLRVGHTRYTHRHLLMGEQAPMCAQCNCIMSVLHILSECPNFNSLRLRYFQSSAISLTDLLGKTPHVHLLPFLKSIGFYPLI